MPNVLVIGATRGLGRCVSNIYATSPNTTVYGTTRSSSAPKPDPSKGVEYDDKIKWVTGVDVALPTCGQDLVRGVKEAGGAEGGFSIVVVTAGYFGREDWETGPNWDEEVKMYTTSSISPPFLIHSLYTSSLLPSTNSPKIILVSSESGSIGLRHKKEGGGNYAHHASKSALNMVGKLLSLDLEDKGVAVGVVHPGFMRTEMTKGVGFDVYWDDGGAVTPEVAAKSLVDWIETDFDISKTGEYWAPRGPRDIGTADVTIGTNLPTPLRLPW